MILFSAVFIVHLSEYALQTNPTAHYEIVLRYFIILSALSFPVGPLATLIVYALFKYLLIPLGIDYYDYMPYFELVIMFVCCAIGGYLQWGVGVPYLWHKFRRK